MYPKFVNMLKFLMTLLIVKLYFSNHPKCQAYSAACKKWSFREIETEEIFTSSSLVFWKSDHKHFVSTQENLISLRLIGI